LKVSKKKQTIYADVTNEEKKIKLMHVSNFIQKNVKRAQISCFGIFFILFNFIEYRQFGFLFNSFNTKRFII